MVNSFSITDIGKKRKMNQDYVFASDSPVGNLPNLYIVADGMGGHKAGDFASRYTVEELVRRIRSDPAPEGRDLLDLTIHRVNYGLYRTAQKRSEYAGCGTTLVLTYISRGTAHIANVGDSRLYVVGSTIRQVTVDHSLVEEMVLAGSLDEKKARTHPEKNVITRAVGAEHYVDIDYFNCDLRRGDILLMCSDGLTNMVENERILEIIRENGTLREKAQALVREANANGGSDNISVILIDCGI